MPFQCRTIKLQQNLFTSMQKLLWTVPPKRFKWKEHQSVTFWFQDSVSRLFGIGLWKVWSQKKSLVDLIVCCRQWKGTNAHNFRVVYWTSRASLTVRIRYELEKRLRSVYIEPKSDHCLASGTNMANLVKAVKGRHQKILVTSHVMNAQEWIPPRWSVCSLWYSRVIGCTRCIVDALGRRSGLTLNNDLVNWRHQARGDLCCLVVSDILLMYH